MSDLVEMCPRVKKKLFGEHGRNVLLVLEEKCSSVHIAEIFALLERHDFCLMSDMPHTGSKSHSMFFTWQIYSRYAEVYLKRYRNRFAALKSHDTLETFVNSDVTSDVTSGLRSVPEQGET